MILCSFSCIETANVQNFYGTQRNLVCLVSSTSWTFQTDNSNEVPSMVNITNNIELDGSVLKISSINGGHEGVYFCEIKKFNLTVIGKILLLYKNNNVRVIIFLLRLQFLGTTLYW